jgi:hypothetical protein
MFHLDKSHRKMTSTNQAIQESSVILIATVIVIKHLHFGMLFFFIIQDIMFIKKNVDIL